MFRATMAWTLRKMPELTGKTMIVTGANSGIGLEAVRGLAGGGARVILACRDVEKKGRDALASIRADHPQADVVLEALDLADLASVRAFAERVLAAHPKLDVLVNNAGVMALPYHTTKDGFEMQLGTNHLGHFALTALLFPRLIETQGARVVTVASIAHRFGRIEFDDLAGQKSYWRWARYAQSKLANLLFAKELARRVDRAGLPVASVACHPGYSSTNLQARGASMMGSSFRASFMVVAGQALAQSSAWGALPTLYAATSDEVGQGEYVGPDGFLELIGMPVKVRVARRAEDAEAAQRLWAVSEELTGVRFDALAG